MNTMRQAVKAVLAAGLLVLGLGVFKEAQAVGGNPDTMTVTVTPGVSYAVFITSPEAQGYDFTTVNIGQSTVSTKAIPVQNVGNIDEFFSIGVLDVTVGAGVAWANNLTPATTTYAMHALFVATSAPQPSTSTFAVDTVPNYVPEAAPGVADSKFGQGSTKTLPNASQDLWLLLRMPTAVHESDPHTLTLSINGQNG